ncbi:MAG: HIT domain-containing protein [Alphaproteobacteria bacterium]|jgi:histidine triad (HIT) family protein
MTKPIYDKENIFAKILNGKIPAKKIYEDDSVLAFHDAYPDAPTHILIVPKGEYTSFTDFTTRANNKEIGEFFKRVNQIVAELKIDDFRLVTNNGAKSGQSVFHFHIHILSGKKLGKLGG